MATFALNDVDIAAGGLDLACFSNNVTLDATVAEVDATTFCAGGWSTPIAGRRSTMLMASGPTDMATATEAQTSAVDEVLAVTLGTVYPFSVVPMGSSVGAIGYFSQGMLQTRTVLDGAAGDLATHSVTFAGSAPLIRGTVDTASTIAATGSSTGAQLGAVSATQRVWAVVHFLTAGGTTPSITVKVQSDNNSGFTSPTDRITFTAATTKGGQFGSAVGAITDDYWRATWTVSGTNPSFQTRIIIGIY